MLHPVGKQAYKLELPKKWRIHDVFHVSLLEQDTTKKGQVNDTQLDFEFEAGDDKDKEYEVDGIRDSAVYAKESAGQLPGLYYLISWKSYPEEENTWEPASAIQHLRRLVTTYHKDNPEKPTATSAPVDTAPPMVRPSAPPRPTSTTNIPIKRKRGRSAGPTAAPTKKCSRSIGSTTTNKRVKKS